MTGYQFGKSNHTIYLLDAFHRTHPNLLNNDWFVTQTFQYHAAFGWITRWLMQAGIVAQGFLVGYLALVIAFHVAWMNIVNVVGGNRRTYLVSVLFYYLSAGGTGLGIYQFFQDSCFLASNISNVAMLWAFYLWMTDKRFWSGFCFGLAGLLHLNYSIVGVASWVALNAWDYISHLPGLSPNLQSLVITLDPQEKRRHAEPTSVPGSPRSCRACSTSLPAPCLPSNAAESCRWRSSSRFTSSSAIRIITTRAPGLWRCGSVSSGRSRLR